MPSTPNSDKNLHLANVLHQATSLIENSSVPNATSEDAGRMTSKDAKKAKKRSWKKPKDKPKRPLSAYNLFFKQERKKIVCSPTFALAKNATKLPQKPKRRRRDRVVHGKIGFADLARNVAIKWKNLDPESRSVYEALAKLEKDRYQKELDVWNKTQDLNKTAIASHCSVEQTESRTKSPVNCDQDAGIGIPCAVQTPTKRSCMDKHYPIPFFTTRHRNDPHVQAIISKMSIDDCLAITKRTLKMATDVLSFPTCNGEPVAFPSDTCNPFGLEAFEELPRPNAHTRIQGAVQTVSQLGKECPDSSFNLQRRNPIQCERFLGPGLENKFKQQEQSQFSLQRMTNAKDILATFDDLDEMNLDAVQVTTDLYDECPDSVTQQQKYPKKYCMQRLQLGGGKSESHNLLVGTTAQPDERPPFSFERINNTGDILSSLDEFDKEKSDDESAGEIVADFMSAFD